jgi:hypothetical protein
MSEEGAKAALSREVKSCSVATSAGPNESLDAARPMALVRWEDGDSQILSEAGLRHLVEDYRAAGLEVPTELQNGL